MDSTRPEIVYLYQWSINLDIKHCRIVYPETSNPTTTEVVYGCPLHTLITKEHGHAFILKVVTVEEFFLDRLTEAYRDDEYWDHSQDGEGIVVWHSIEVFRKFIHSEYGEDNTVTRTIRGVFGANPFASEYFQEQSV